MAEQLGTILPNEERNHVGICHMDVVPVQDVQHVPDVVDGAIAEPLQLHTGAQLHRVHFEDDGGHFTEEWQVERGLQSSRARISGAVAKDKLPYLRRFWAAKGRRYLVLITTRNGDQLLMGTLATPAMLIFGHRTAGNDPDSDRSEYSGLFSLASRHPVPFYLAASPPVAPPGQPCPTLAELLPGASVSEITDNITGAQAVALAAYFAANCPTLAQLVAGASNAALYAALSLAQASYIANEVITVVDGNGGPGDVVIDPTGTPPPSGAHFAPGHFAAGQFRTA